MQEVDPAGKWIMDCFVNDLTEFKKKLLLFLK